MTWIHLVPNNKKRGKKLWEEARGLQKNSTNSTVDLSSWFLKKLSTILFKMKYKETKNYSKNTKNVFQIILFFIYKKKNKKLGSNSSIYSNTTFS